MANKTSVVKREDYKAPNHDVESIDLTFDLIPNNTIVTSRFVVVPRKDRLSDELVLDGECLTLISLKINGEDCFTNQYNMTPGKLVIDNIQSRTEIEIITRIKPKENLELSGLYMSKGNFITQCEAEGFRRITYFPDRPDILAKYKVTLHAPKDCKVLLSNGNLLEEGELPDGRKFAVWEDPFPKPSYLFALVAGNFVAHEEHIQLMTGKTALLQIWVEPGNENKTAYAMESLKRAIRWDEARFGLSLDLERFMIVATDDFNMGAMENKGLNIFNSKYVLANEHVATDDDFAAIETVIGHEYFHNWTGDRVTCRDWFQLSLKEGLTVFREQEFASDMLGNESARAIKRIKDVNILRTSQFPEDAGPMAHPVRPESYCEINNFYTMTVYEKGAEVVRMYQTMFGKEGFKRGLRAYLDRFDGSAATCDDFRNTMAEVNKADLKQFDRWYSQAGTPRVFISTEWDENNATLKVTATQSNRVFPGQPKPQPLFIPIAIGCLDDKGKDMNLWLEGEPVAGATTRILNLTEEKQTWTFIKVNKKPLLSVGRGFSAPAIFEIDYTRDQLVFLSKNDSDLFNRAEAFRKLTLLAIDGVIADIRSSKNVNIINPIEAYLQTFEDIINDEKLSPAYRAEILKLPSEASIYESSIIIEPQLIRTALEIIRKKIGNRLRMALEDKIKSCETAGAYRYTPEDAGKRALHHLALMFLVCGGNPTSVQNTRRLFEKSNNLTDKLDALRIAVLSGLPYRQEMLNLAAAEWKNEPLLINKWLQINAIAPTSSGNKELSVIERIRSLLSDPLFDLHNPNKVYSLLGTFFKNGGPEFHHPSGQGYQLWIDTVVRIDRFNPQVAARLARAMENWRRFEPKLASMMYKSLMLVSQEKNLSVDVREIVDKALYEPV